ncbi:MAG: bifunctional tRNA (5-methylaminomethyl-2-thiouridine)(34)-methyltransferase MnmD/FAD-dependent 5-carboxymethylaminomethyl-2-thiouridine(34) oxidoreductase MnmC [SAR86 cluster bacterium]|uniref:tRNA 5-methylaminomethyl-2-thiouridine biosynthesis bifunctional protein MnmC n=1 Tax=SAR86 cluster bacterium TaxID=2030880 RepID=A0A2A5BC72_9GAMM|nr:MAG: bifunctional tRNA (5-methylaminomethyl-2-thiouridine)(34)-methyltransferase MnmD/FAD-dependent 5-carboxymethylaminomethyl-2-thiouridine(34) oxidoreductase MnmC [SAR86 cluster bacterium]
MKVENAQIQWLDSGLPYSSLFDDVYYSKDDEQAESLHVFLNANRLSQRWAETADSCEGREANKSAELFTIAELGFGSGLNFLQVAKLWQESSSRPSRLNYIAFEKHPLTCEQLQRIHQRWPNLKAQSDELQRYYPDHSIGCHRICLSHDITLDLYYGEAFSQLKSRYTKVCRAIDCWFLDGFSPRLNPKLWEQQLFGLIAKTCNEKSTISSYSVAGTVRNALGDAGFAVQKLPGHGKKRHMLFAQLKISELSAVKEPSDKDFNNLKPWFKLSPVTFSKRTVTVIGAGLAGCSTAYSLARRGWQVKVIDNSDAPASGASGNSQLALRCRLFKSYSDTAEFFLHSFLFAARQFSALKIANSIDWNNCGVLQLNTAMNKQQAISDEELASMYSKQVIQALSLDTANKKAGAALNDPAWFLPAGGWINPETLCEAYLSHPNIELVLGKNVDAIKPERDNWAVIDDRGEHITSEAVVIANAYSAKKFEQTRHLPLQVVRGQTTQISANGLSSSLKAVVSGKRTVFPESQQCHVISASYSNTDLQESSSTNDNECNMTLAKSNFSDKDFLSTQIVSDRVSQRCNSIDQLPVIGMVANASAMKKTYAELSRNATATIDSPGDYHRGLYISVAHGSNGLASCPLSGEFLAALMTGENLPLSQAMINNLSPARFVIRDLKKQKG